MQTYFDAHCHWARGDDPEGPAFGMEEGVRMVCCGTGPEDWEDVRRAASVIKGMTAAYGLHPWRLRVGDDLGGRLVELAGRLRADARAAVGEIGLDFAVRDCPVALQRDAFLEQLRLAKALVRVAVIHCVQAWGALLETLDACGPLPCGFVLHAYGGSEELITPLVGRGAYFSFKNVRTEDKSYARAAARVRAVPPERLLLESDLYLCASGAGDYGERLKQTATFLASATGQEVAPVAEQTFANAVRCFHTSNSGVER